MNVSTSTHPVFLQQNVTLALTKKTMDLSKELAANMIQDFAKANPPKLTQIDVRA